jgi:hypothetical protein
VSTRPEKVQKHEPKHRAPASRRAPQKALRTSLTLSTMAVVATGLAVSGGAVAGLGDSSGSADLASAANDISLDTGAATADAAADLAAEAAAKVDATTLTAPRDALVTRSDRRQSTDPLKADLLAIGGSATTNALTRTEDLSDEDPRTVARALLAEFGFGEDQFGCLDSLWERESHWNVYADNPSSSAYGIPQALPGSKMSSAGPDWATNPVTQIRWGLGYIEDRYGSPCGAWGHSQSHGWY